MTFATRRSFSVKGSSVFLSVRLSTPITCPRLLRGTDSNDLELYWLLILGRPKRGSPSISSTNRGCPSAATQPASRSPMRSRVPRTTFSSRPRAERMTRSPLNLSHSIREEVLAPSISETNSSTRPIVISTAASSISRASRGMLRRQKKPSAPLAASICQPLDSTALRAR